MTPTVSVLVGVRNGVPWLPFALASLASQSLTPEIIVVDDGSTDETPKVLERAEQDHGILWTRQESANLSVALNRAARLAQAPYLARLDADDLAFQDRFARQVAAMDAEASLVLLGSATFQADETGTVPELVSPPTTDADIRRVLRWRNPFVHSTVMMRRDAFWRAGGYDETLPVAQDYDLWVRLAPLGTLRNLEEPLVFRLTRREAPERTRDRRRVQWIVRWRALAA